MCARHDFGFYDYDDVPTCGRERIQHGIFAAAAAAKVRTILPPRESMVISGRLSRRDRSSGRQRLPDSAERQTPDLINPWQESSVLLP